MAPPTRSARFSKTEEPDTPYRKAHELWDQRMGSALAHARTWRLATFLSLVLNGLAATAVILLALRPAAIPFVIEANETGETRLIGPAKRATIANDAEIAWHLARFIEQIRSLPADPVVLRQNWLAAYDWTTEAGAEALNAMAAANDPFANIGRNTISVEVLSVVRASPSSFQLRWRETTYASGVKIRSERFTGVATIVIDAPTTPGAIEKNPLGLFIHAFTFSRDLSQ